jgi:hypothetical protein
MRALPLFLALLAAPAAAERWTGFAWDRGEDWPVGTSVELCANGLCATGLTGTEHSLSVPVDPGERIEAQARAVAPDGRKSEWAQIAMTWPVPALYIAADLGGNNVVQNAGFESGTSGWNFYTNATGSFTVAGPGDGSVNAGVVTTTTVGTNIQLNQSGLALQPNTAYRLTFSAYSNTGHDLRVSVLKHGSPFTNYGLNLAIANLTTGWQSFTFDFTTTGFSTAVADARLMFWFASDAAPGDQFRIDNVSLATSRRH